MKTKLFLIALTAAAFSASTAWAAGLDITINGDIRLGRRAPPPPPRVEIVVGEPAPSGPAPWERSRWNRRTYGYYYYPGADAYYRVADHVWFYQQRNEWVYSRRLPDFVRVDFDRGVALTMITDRPYTYHEHVVTRYPANYFDRRRHSPDNDRDNRHDDNRHRDRDRDRDNRR